MLRAVNVSDSVNGSSGRYPLNQAKLLLLSKVQPSDRSGTLPAEESTRPTSVGGDLLTRFNDVKSTKRTKHILALTLPTYLALASAAMLDGDATESMPLLTNDGVDCLAY